MLHNTINNLLYHTAAPSTYINIEHTIIKQNNNIIESISYNNIFFNNFFETTLNFNTIRRHNRIMKLFLYDIINNKKPRIFFEA